MNCTKAIIPLAGYGTRRLPITKVVEKSLLPVLNRPIIDYIVADCIKAGITDIYFVVCKGSTQVRDYYGTNVQLESYLATHNKTALLAAIAPPEHVSFHFVEQDTAGDSRYGTAVPVWLCRQYIEPDEHVLVVSGDDFIYNDDDSSEVARLIDCARSAQGDSVILAAEVPRDTVSNYGVIVQRHENGQDYFAAIQEQPSIEEAQSNLINISKYLFTASFFDYLDKTMQVEQAHEYRITDTINDFVADGNNLQVLPAHGVYLDGGTVEGWLAANNYVAEHPVRTVPK